MRSILIISFLFLQFFSACSDNEQQAAENEVDAARNFIRHALDGHYDEAKKLMVQDSANKEYIDLAAQVYKNMPSEEKRGYRESSINIHSVRPVQDSVSMVYYSNSFKKVTDSLTVVKKNGEWLIDRKFSFPPPLIDSLQ